MSANPNAAAVAGMIAGHKLHNRVITDAANPYYKPANLTESLCKTAWTRGLAEGVYHAKNGLSFKRLCEILVEVKK